MKVRVTAPVQFGQLRVAPALAAFLRRHRRVRAELLLLDRVVDLVDEGIDLAVRIERPADSSLVAVPVGTVHSVVCASPAFLAEAGTPARPRDLAALPCIVGPGAGAAGGWGFREAGRNITVRVDGPLVCNQVAAAAAACTGGLGFGRFLSYQVRALVADGRLVPVLEEFAPEPLPVSLVYPGTRLVTSRLRALVDWLREDLRRAAGTVADSPAEEVGDPRCTR